jgi:Ni/Co efflux regulator RcnB
MKGTQNRKAKHMKKLLTTIASAVTVLALMAACQTTNTTQSAAAQQEPLLAKSGFKTIAVTTPKQQQAVNKLPQGTVSAVKYQGKQYYVYPTASNNKIYVGKQKHLNAYNQAVAAQQAQGMNPPPTMTFQGHGPHQVVAEEFDGFGPMGVNSLGDW